MNTAGTGSEPSALVVDFPLRGEWVAGATPAQRVPSHGTDALGQRYAYDFLRIDRARNGWKFFRGSLLRYLVFGVRLRDCYGWGEPICAPFDATVVVARDGWPEPKWLHPLRSFALVARILTRHPRLLGPMQRADMRHVAGNYIVLKPPGDDVYAFCAHARTDSIRVHDGQTVNRGQHIADVGHSGNSTAPHLHFHLMDRADIRDAKGLPCRFRRYESFRNGEWHEVAGGMPGKREFVRHHA